MGKNERLLETVERFFEEDEWVFDKIEGQQVLTAGFRGDNGTWRCYAQVEEDEQWFAFYSTLDTNTPEDRRHAVAELLTLANYGLIIGNFEMDLRDGEVRYKTSINVTDDRLTVALVRPLVYFNLFTMDRYLESIMSVAFGNVAPADAIAKVEARLSSP